MTPEQQEIFKLLEPWTTKFIIDGEECGGIYRAYEDSRVDQFLERYGCEYILELGSLEGGHSIRFAKEMSVIAIEGRYKNIIKSEFIARVFDISSDQLQFKLADLDKVENLYDYLPGYLIGGDIGAISCIGVLYHMNKPWELIKKMGEITRNVFVWTHYVSPEKAIHVENGYKGLRIDIGNSNISTDSLSKSEFWFTKESLLQAFKDNGFGEPEIIEDCLDHPYHKDKSAITISYKSGE